MTNPAPGTRIELEIGATADGTLTGLDAAAGLRHRRLHRMADREHRRDPHRGAVSLAGVGRQGVTASRRTAFGTGSYRGPGGPQASFALEKPHRRAGDASSASTRSSSGRATLVARATRWSTASHGPASATRRSSSAVRDASALAGPSRPAARARASASRRRVAGRQGAGRRDVPARGRRHGHDHHRRRRHERHDRRVRRSSPPRRSASTPVAGQRRRVDTDGAPRSPMSGGIGHHVFVGPGDPRARRPRTGARCSAYAALEMEIDPADLEIVDGVSGRRARRTRAGRSPSSPRSSTTSAASPSRSRATAPACRPASRRRLPRHLAHVRVDPRDRRGHASSASSSRRTSGARSTRRSSRARCAAASSRASAGPCTRS